MPLSDRDGIKVAAAVVGLGAIWWRWRSRVPSSTAVATPCRGQLDDASGPDIAGLSLGDYVARCDAAIAAALTWPAARVTKNDARVAVGHFPGVPVLSMFWVQDIDEADTKNGSTLAAIHRLMMDPMGLHTDWDATFLGQEVLGKWPGDFDGDAELVLRSYSAGPLAKRDMLYFMSCRESGFPEGKIFTYGYPSVHDSWVKAQLSRSVPATGYVRSVNLFPSVDRVKVLDGGARIRIEHLLTTQIGGWVPDCLWNTGFKQALVDTYAKEADLFRDHVARIVQSSTA